MGPLDPFGPELAKQFLSLCGMPVQNGSPGELESCRVQSPPINAIDLLGASIMSCGNGSVPVGSGERIVEAPL